MIALYVLVAFPAWLGVNVCLDLMNSGYGIPRAIIAAVIGVVLAGFFVFKLHRSRDRRWPLGRAVSLSERSPGRWQADAIAPRTAC